MELAELKENVVQLESSLVEKQNEILFLEEEVRSLRLKLAKRDAELLKQDRELNKLRVRKNKNIDFRSVKDKCLFFSCQSPWSISVVISTLSECFATSLKSYDTRK